MSVSIVEYTTDMLVEIIDKCIEHWRENTEKAEEGTLDLEDISSDKCALCGMTEGLEAGCWVCPLEYFSIRCDEDDSCWMSVRNNMDYSTEAAVNACTTMRYELEKVREATARHKLYIVRDSECDVWLKEGYDEHSESS